MGGAPERLEVFNLVNGKRNAKEMAKITQRKINNIHRDLSKLFDAGLIELV